jgi:hypothetical protein
VSRLAWGIAVWTPAFLALELPAHWGLTPWPTLSSTVWDLIAWWHPMAYFTVLFMVVLLGHFEFHWSAGWVVGAALIGTALIIGHLAVR